MSVSAGAAGISADRLDDEAHVHTLFPVPRGERALAERLVRLSGAETHLWFSVDYLPGVPEIDVVLLHEGIGLFLFEVKAVPHDLIQEYGPARCVIQGRGGTRTPLSQARTATLKLIDFLRDEHGLAQRPFIHISAVWPLIERRAFLDRWDHRTVARQAGSMVFADDLADSATWVAHLRHIVTTPASGAAVRGLRPPDDQIVESTVRALATAHYPKRGSDDRRLKALARPRHAATLAEPRASLWTPGQASKVLIRGAVGTGKTSRLLEVGLDHAGSGRRVLFACFNKVLAAELRRLLHADPERSRIAEQMDIVDVEQLFHRHGSPAVTGDYDSARSRAVAELSAKACPDPYDTVLIDEAQDLADWAFHLIEWTARPGADWYLAEGPGQELYRTEPAPWLAAERGRARGYATRRSFRNKGLAFLVPQCFHETTPQRQDIGGWLERYDRRTVMPTLLDLEPDPAPKLTRLAELPKHGWRVARIADYARVIAAELQTSRSLGAAGDLLILVPRTHDKGSEGTWVLEALRTLGVSHIDQIENGNRRRMLEPGQVRVTTYHSARGLDAARSLVFGFHQLDHLGPLQQQRALGYIALSRGRRGTSVALDPEHESDHVRHLVEICRRVAEPADEAGS